MGIINKAMQPSNVDAHLGFNVSYICLANNGNAAPNKLRTTVLPAKAEAAKKR